MVELEDVQEELEHYKNMFKIMKSWVTVLVLRAGGKVSLTQDERLQYIDHDVEIIDNFDNGKTLVAYKKNFDL